MIDSIESLSFMNFYLEIILIGFGLFVLRFPSLLVLLIDEQVVEIEVSLVVLIVHCEHAKLRLFSLLLFG